MDLSGGLIARDLWPLPSGELAVRPGLAKILDYEPATPAEEIVFFRSFRVSTTDEVRWIVIHDGLLDLVDAETGETIQSISLAATANGALASVAQVEGRLLVAVPGGDLYYGWDNNTLEPIQAANAGIIDTLDTLLPPDACVAEYSGRAAYTDGTSVYVSDPLIPRAVVGNNVFTPPGGGAVLRLMTGENGDLWVVTSSEVFILPSENAAQGQGLQGGLRRTAEFRARDGLAVAYAADRPWGLTHEGVISLDAERRTIRCVPRTAWGSSQTRLPTTCASARLHGYGHMLVLDFGDGLHVVVDARTGFASAWNTPEYAVADQRGGFGGLGVGFEGSLVIATGYSVCSPEWYNDGDENGSNAVTGGFVFTEIGGPDNAGTVREIRIRTDSRRATGGEDVLGSSYAETTHEDRAPVPGTVTDWSTEVIAAPMLERYSFRLEIVGDERCAEAYAHEPLSRVYAGTDRTMRNVPERTHQ